MIIIIIYNLYQLSLDFHSRSQLIRVLYKVYKQQRWRRLRQRHLKSEFALLQTLSRLFHLV